MIVIVIVVVGANVIVAALGNENDTVGVIDLPWTCCGRQTGLAETPGSLTPTG